MDAEVAKNKRQLPPRLRLVRRLAGLMAAVAAVVLFGIADLMTLPGWVDQRYIWAVSLEASWGSLLTFIVAGSYASIALNPRQPWPGAVLLAVAAAALALGSVFGADARPLPLAAIVVGPAVVLVWLARDHAGPFPRTFKPSWPYLLPALAGLPLWISYAVHAFTMSRLEPNAGHETWGIEHWPVQGAAGLVLAASGLILAWWVPGRPLVRVAASLSAAYIGTAMLAYPDRDGAMGGPLWGIAMVLWGTVLALPVPRPGD
jgi:hypothetical protein